MKIMRVLQILNKNSTQKLNKDHYINFWKQVYKVNFLIIYNTGVIWIQKKDLFEGSLIPKNYVHPTGGWTYYFCFFRRPPPGIRTLGFRSFEEKVFILSLPNLVWVFIGLIACMGLLLVKLAL